MSEAYRVLKKMAALLSWNPQLKIIRRLNYYLKYCSKQLLQILDICFQKTSQLITHLWISLKNLLIVKTFLKILSDNNFIKCIHKTYSLGVIDFIFPQKIN